MMEKNGMLTLTSEDMTLYKKGEVSKRLQKGWELDFNSLDMMIKAGSFTVAEDSTSKGCVDVNLNDTFGD